MNTALLKKDYPHLAGVKKIIAVSSAKGGVGKSTIAFQLARRLAGAGLKIGLLDADIYGPSLPILFQLPGIKAKSVERVLQPVEKDQLKLMSFGFLLGEQSAIFRGPMVGRYIKHMLTQTNWGDLDILLIDFPPGTGDIPLTITQTVHLDGAFIVTTPHQLALADVARGVKMFRRMQVPILGIIENMAYVEANGEKNYIFGQLDQKRIETDLNAKFVAHIPVDAGFGTFPAQEAFERLADLLRQTA